MLEIRPDDPKDLLHKNFFRYRAQIEQDFQRALRALERNHLFATPSEQEENPETGSVSQTDLKVAATQAPAANQDSPHPSQARHEGQNPPAAAHEVSGSCSKNSH